MPSLADKLRQLGVKVGVQELTISPSNQPADQSSPGAMVEKNAIPEVLGGHLHATYHGDTIIIDKFYPVDYQHGRSILSLKAPRDMLAIWANVPRSASLPANAYAFIDTETTGLSGGAGTYAFLIGVGRFESGGLHVSQIFLQGPESEPAQLYALEEILASCEAVITFNGKSFDIPLLTTRFTMHGLKHPFTNLAHIDLLHLARRLWRDRLSSRTLGSLEAQILDSVRTAEDIPGWSIPQIYMDYLRSGDAKPLKGVLYHNEMDIVSLAALFDHIAELLADPFAQEVHHAVDIIALGKLFEDLGNLDLATRLYIHGLEHEDARELRLPRSSLLQALERLALIHKRQENYQAAIPLWEEAARYYHLPACIELAKYYEHTQTDYRLAIHWTETAINITSQQNPASQYFQAELIENLAELHHRLGRLQRKVERANDE